MTKFDKRFESVRQDWETPKSFFDKVDAIYNFDFDLAADDKNRKCAQYFTKEDNALEQTWYGTCWLNPPYHGGSKLGLQYWVKKSYEESRKPGCKVVLLIPARTNVNWWRDYCMRARSVLFVIGRPIFVGAKYGLPQPLVLVEFDGDGYKPDFGTIEV